MKVLFLCTGNSCRSQMAEGYLRDLVGERVEVFSAGIETHGLNPNAVQVMADDGIDISDQTSDHVSEFREIDFDYVITVCDHASEHCPVFHGGVHKMHQNFPDPARATGTAEEIQQAFVNTRNLIKDFCQKFVTDHIEKGKP